MNLKLLPNRILVEEIEEKTDGVQIVKATKGSEARGRVVGGNPGRLATDRLALIEQMPVGSVIHFVKGSGEELAHEGKNYRVLYVSADRESEVLAIESYPDRLEGDRIYVDEKEIVFEKNPLYK